MNISPEGLLLSLTAPIEPYALLTIQIFLGDDEAPIIVTGESRWIRDAGNQQGYLLGLAFVALQSQIGQRWAEAIYSVSLS